MPDFRKLDCLRNRRISGNAAHVQKLVHAEPHEIDKVGIDTRESASNALLENCVNSAALSEHSVHELTKPAAIARVEICGATLER